MRGPSHRHPSRSQPSFRRNELFRPCESCSNDAGRPRDEHAGRLNCPAPRPRDESTSGPCKGPRTPRFGTCDIVHPGHRSNYFVAEPGTR